MKLLCILRMVVSQLMYLNSSLSPDGNYLFYTSNGVEERKGEYIMGIKINIDAF
ncbi:hypothetical protein ACFLTE_03450 [Bacteroidota bacterium]